jgi:hypothetical protein
VNQHQNLPSAYAKRNIDLLRNRTLLELQQHIAGLPTIAQDRPQFLPAVIANANNLT